MVIAPTETAAITVGTDHGPLAVPAAFKTQHFGVHRQVVGLRMDGPVYSEQWSITHVPTGRLVATMARQERACLAASILELITDWSSADVADYQEPLLELAVRLLALEAECD